MSWDWFPRRQQGCGSAAIMLPRGCHCFTCALSLLLCPAALPCAGPMPGCCSGAARTGLASQKASLATSQGRNTLAEDMSDSLTKRRLQGSPFFAPFAAQQLPRYRPGCACTGALRSLAGRCSPCFPESRAACGRRTCFAGPLQSGLDTKTNDANCSPEPYVHIPLQFLLCSASPFHSQFKSVHV